MALLVVALLAGVLKALVPLGPTGLLVMDRALGGRRRNAMAVAAGGAIVEAACCLAAVLGARSVLARLPELADTVRRAGAFAIVAVGLYFALRREKPLARAARADTVHLAEDLLLGVTTAALNPAMLLTWIFLVGVLASQGFRFSGLGGLLFPAFLAIGTLSTNMVVVTWLGRATRHMSSRSAHRVLRTIGFVLVICGAWQWMRH